MSGDQNNPWRTLSSKTVYSNPWITVQEDQVIRPDGTPGIYGVVSTRIAVGVVALTAENEIYLVGQYRYPTKHYSWEIPEGGTEGIESPLETAKRELLEEAGVLASHWEPLGSEIHLSNCFSSEVAVSFVARNLTLSQPKPDGTEVLQIKRLPFHDCLEMVCRGEIKDALSIISIFRVAKLLGLP